MAFTMSPIFEFQALLSQISHPFLISFIILASLFVLKWGTPTGLRTKSYKDVMDPPSPPRLPIIGNLHQLGKQAHNNLRSMALDHGPLMLIYLGSVPAYVVSSANIAKEMLKTHDKIFSNRSDSYIFRRVLYDGNDILLAPYGEYWRHIRAIAVLQLLSAQRVQSFEAVREEEVAMMIENIKATRSSINLSKMLGTLTIDILCKVAFGKKYSQGGGDEKFKKFFDEFGELMGIFNIGEYIPWLNWINHFNGLNARVNTNVIELDNMLDRIIDDRIATQCSTKGSKEHTQMDLMDVLLENHQNQDTNLSRTSMKAIITDMFAGGSDTTHSALEWAMTELMRHPSIMAKVQRETRVIVGDKKSTITRDDINKMHYLKAVIKETLRMHPPIPLLPRMSSHDVNLHGYNIPAKTRVFINLTAIGRDAKRWDEPNEFRPERFLDVKVCNSSAQDFDYMPFGGGRRGCPGITFTSAVMELVLANLLFRFDWSLPDGARGEDLDVEETCGLNVHKKNPLVVVASSPYALGQC